MSEACLLWSAAVFAVWANLHTGFVYGLLLIALYAMGERLERILVFAADRETSVPARRSLWPHLIAAGFGTLLQPFGWNAYKVLWLHWRDMDALSSQILEWRPVQVGNPWHWPYWIVLFGAFGAALAHLARNRRIAFGPLAALLYYGVAAAQHARLGAYYATIAVPLGLHWVHSGRPWPGMSVRAIRASAVAVIIASASYSVGLGRNFGLFRAIFHPRFIPVGTAEFLDRERAALGGRLLYHPWGWGGYLGWRLYPDYRIFQDGRYIFHPLLDEAARAAANPRAWREFLERHRVEVAVMENMPWRLPTTRLYPDGTRREFPRPYYILYMPKAEWALVYWDADALVFVRRSPADAALGGWLRRHEYLYARPHDEEALEDVLRRKEIPAAAVRAEFQREATELPRAPSP